MSRPGCVICGAPHRLPGRTVCTRCNRGVGRTRGPCGGCGKPDRLLDHNRCCRWCRERANKRCADCSAVHKLITIHGVRVCQRCALRRHTDRVLPPDGRGPLHPLRELIVAADPISTPRWLNRAHDLLVGLNEGRIPLEHTALDQLPHPKSVEHLRALLIAAEILPPDPGRDLRRLETELPDMLAELNPAHQKLTTRWVRWAELPRLRRVLDHGRNLNTSVLNTRRKIEQVTAFLTTLERDDRNLGSCTQHDIDAWFTGPGAIRWQIRPFLTWTKRNRHLPTGLSFPRSYQGTPAQPVDSERRWQIAKRLINDEGLDPVDRMAGALVVLYAQNLARIVTLRTSDVIIDDGVVHLKLGTDPVELPEPFAAVIQQLPHKRRDSAADQLPNPWLFASTHAGRHITAHALGERLRAIGIEPRRMRLAAAEQLAREIPPAMLTGILGLKPPTIVRLTTQANGQWANYAADRPP